MKLNGRPPSNISAFSDDEDAVHSGSATGFSDVDPTEDSSQSKHQKNIGSPFDPVNTILDKIDAELVSLTRSQSVSRSQSVFNDANMRHAIIFSIKGTRQLSCIYGFNSHVGTSNFDILLAYALLCPCSWGQKQYMCVSGFSSEKTRYSRSA